MVASDAGWTYLVEVCNGGDAFGVEFACGMPFLNLFDLLDNESGVFVYVFSHRSKKHVRRLDSFFVLLLLDRLPQRNTQRKHHKTNADIKKEEKAFQYSCMRVMMLLHKNIRNVKRLISKV